MDAVEYDLEPIDIYEAWRLYAALEVPESFCTTKEEAEKKLFAYAMVHWLSMVKELKERRSSSDPCSRVPL